MPNFKIPGASVEGKVRSGSSARVLIARKPLKQSQNEARCSDVYLRSRLRRTLVFTGAQT